MKLTWGYYKGWGLLLSVGLALSAISRNAFGDEASTTVVKSRRFSFTYGVTISELEPGKKVRIWVPVAPSNFAQTVEVKKISSSVTHQMTTEKKFGNPLLYFEGIANKQGEIPIDVEYQVERKEIVHNHYESVGKQPQTYSLNASKMIPVDGTVLTRLMKGQAVPGKSLADIRALYDSVDGLMKYDKPEGKAWGRGDALWACDAKYGNCTDFHSVFIGACRDLKIPAKFEIGFPLPDERGSGEIPGYHCWAQFAWEGKWIPVDISEADKHPELKDYYFGNLTENRITFTEGRDLVLEPPAASGEVNFLVYPLVEVDGKSHAKFVKRFRFKDAP